MCHVTGTHLLQLHSLCKRGSSLASRLQYRRCAASGERSAVQTWSTSNGWLLGHATWCTAHWHTALAGSSCLCTLASHTRGTSGRVHDRAGRAKEVPRESDPTLGGQPCPTIKEHLTNEIGRWSCQDLVLPGPHHQRWVTAKRGYGPGRTIWSWQDQVLVPLTDGRPAISIPQPDVPAVQPPELRRQESGCQG